eukprot:XP_019079672.1 PREDICTED: uncharacterized protein LOC100244183 [Vitis vinifera]
MAVVKHFSHKHPLCHAEVKEEDGFVCSGCELGLSGSAYKCTISNCDFLLHDSCFKLAPVIKQRSHPHHPLTLLPSPPYDDSGFTCEACLYYGHAFVYHCPTCHYDLHVGCASLPETVIRGDHQHPLTLFYCGYKEEGNTFICDVCHGNVPDGCWIYYCKSCDYGTHLGCATAEASPVAEEEEGTEEYSMAEAESRLKLLQLQMQLAQQNAESIIDAARMLSRPT